MAVVQCKLCVGGYLLFGKKNDMGHAILKGESQSLSINTMFKLRGKRAHTPEGMSRAAMNVSTFGEEEWL